MASGTVKPSSRYRSYDSRSSTSSHFSDPSSSHEFNNLKTKTSSSSSRALVKAKPSNTAKLDPTFTTMVKKFMDRKPKSSSSAAATATRLIIPSDFLAKDLKKDAKKVAGFSALQKKLFGKGASEKKEKVKALTEVKNNTRTLAMVLRSERELLSINKEQEQQVSQLKQMLEDKNKEVEKLKDLCLKQREEIKSLKSAILFPDVMNSQLQELLEKQGSELKQAKQVIPALQQQVSSLTGQLQSLAEDLAEVKADKYSAKAGLPGYGSSPRTPTHAREDASNFWEFSSDDQPDDLLLNDLNPCLTPCAVKSRSREFEGRGSGSMHDESLSDEDDAKVYPGMKFSSHDRKFSKSSDCCHNSSKISVATKAGRRSDESKLAYGGRMNHKFA
ncbi:hypothetical protein GLYMA_15G117000v4 [Glycine max]|uniref:Uncharacterized protein n=1 Tax=Glycine max TaxID=3847 RepID=I1MFQ4_SOYBN|nr:mediator of RNA polymerase II transcription subunit 2 [Glycine max]KAG4948861.1 hypothetical protein JHK86_042100 [Glycine max]KAH1146710.1 hypothetical protein GYH30_042072 [Glycine max]KRH11556.1 hypothetical protein GLYMA_15G117000v4 [Glycine max]|eukprot:XP_003547284.1 mediator of RNA polymerase II transcription subunit 2 [Glycine max]